MFREENYSWNAVLETDEGVFPVTDVVSEADVEDGVAEVVGVEIEPEGVDYVGGFLDEDKGCGGGRATAGAGGGVGESLFFVVGYGSSAPDRDVLDFMQ